MKFEDNTGNELDLNEFDLQIKYLSNIFNEKTSIDDVFIKQEKLEILIDLYDDHIMEKIFYDNNFYNSPEGRQQVLDRTECNKNIIPNYTPNYKKISDDNDRTKN